jgi:hypothetical protein
VKAPDYEPMEFWSSEEEGEADLAAWLATQSETTPYTGGDVVDFPGAAGE